MSEDQFLKLLQSMITMAIPSEVSSRMHVKAALINLYALAYDSGKCNALTFRMMRQAIDFSDRLISMQNDFAGVPGDYEGNKAKRDRLRMKLMPHC